MRWRRRQQVRGPRRTRIRMTQSWQRRLQLSWRPSLTSVSFGEAEVTCAPEHLSPSDLSMAYSSPGAAPPFGTDSMGRPLLEYALQGSRVIALPSIVAGLVVMLPACALEPGTIGSREEAEATEKIWLDSGAGVTTCPP